MLSTPISLKTYIAHSPESDACPGRYWAAPVQAGPWVGFSIPGKGSVPYPSSICLASPWFELEHDESAQREGKADPVPLFPWDELIPAASRDGDNPSSSFKAIKESFFFSFFFFFFFKTMNLNLLFLLFRGFLHLPMTKDFHLQYRF